jgi:serine/threonine protein kinase
VDVWSLGCCLYYLCTKKDPFEGRNPAEIKSNIMYGRLEKYTTKFDPVIKALINKCLEKDENKRLDAKAMLEYQNQLECEAYGEIKSLVMLEKIKAEYDAIMKDTMVH